ncbi:MAG: MetQ/NlpA family ABC transporter substrate-binding protein [Micrococcales bacterium]|nr:MetQ/NlpA family ABC transporter substrate-binding protein [Micrococcales bacterium]
MTTSTTKTAAALIAAVAFALSGCSSSPSTPDPADNAPVTNQDFTAPGDDDRGGKNHPVTIGVVGADGPQFHTLKTNAEAEGIFIELVDFTDYQQPNPATAAGDLDLNQFQHIRFLAQYNNESGADLVPIGSTAIYPLSLFSTKYGSVEEIPDGAQITIPNDETNLARALGVLASAGLIELKEGASPLFTTLDDVEASNSRIVVTPVSANQTGRTLQDPSVAGAIINNDYVADTGLEPSQAIAKDDPSSSAALPFVNIWVTRAADATDPVYVEIVRLAQQDDFGEGLLANSAGSGVVLTIPADKLQSDLADVQAQLRDH